MRCSAQSDAGSAADPEWEAVLAQLLAEEAEEEELCCRFERRGDDSDDGWDNYSEEEEDAAVQGVAGKVDESLERRDERACATGGGFSMPQAAPTSMGYHSCDCIEEGFNIQQTGIEGDRMSASDVSSVPIVTNQSHPSSKIRACPDPEPSAAPSRARRASATSTSAAPTSKRSRRAAKKESKNRVPQAAARFDAHFPPHYRYSHDDHQALDVFGAWQRSIGTREFDPASREYNLLSSLLRRALPRPAVLGGPARPGLPPWEAEDLGDYDLLNPSSAARRKQVLLEEGWPRGELPSKVGLREHMQARAALRYKVGLVYHGNAAETGEYLYDPNYTPTRDIEQVVHTLSAMFKPTSVEPELRQGL